MYDESDSATTVSYLLTLCVYVRMHVLLLLHCRKVLIESKSKDLLPEWLRFVKVRLAILTYTKLRASVDS